VKKQVSNPAAEEGREVSTRQLRQYNEDILIEKLNFRESRFYSPAWLYLSSACPTVCIAFTCLNIPACNYATSISRKIMPITAPIMYVRM